MYVQMFVVWHLKPKTKATEHINNHILDRTLMDRVKFENRPVHTQQRFQNLTVQSNNKTTVQLTLRLSIHLIQSISHNGTFDSSQKIEESKSLIPIFVCGMQPLAKQLLVHFDF